MLSRLNIHACLYIQSTFFLIVYFYNYCTFFNSQFHTDVFAEDYYYLLGITHLSPHKELVHLPYIAVALPPPWETLAVREKRALVKTASKNYRKNPTNTNALKLKTAQYQLAGVYIKEQTEYIQNQIDKIRDSVEDRQSRIAWQTINEVSRRKNTAKAKLKAAN